MHFLKKMMTVVIMLMAGLSGQGWCAAIATTCVDFPQETPGLKGIIKVASTHRYCFTKKEAISGNVHINIIRNKTIPYSKKGDNFIWVKVPATRADIYFPVDGRQPTTQKAAEWSCANIDNTLTSPITEWYMQMFGLLPIDRNNTYLKISNDKDYKDVSIISFLYLKNADIETKKKWEEEKQKCIDDFRIIFSTPIGRLWGYRMLIEVRRKKDGGIWCEEDNISQALNLRRRTRMRILRKKFREITIYIGKNGFADKDSALYYNSDNNIQTTVITDIMDRSRDCVFVELEYRPTHVALFHELVHWYHAIRNYERYIEELTQDRTQVINKCIGALYYNNDDNDEKAHWLTNYKGNEIISFEDMRTIFGMHSESEGYFEGDDLSENLYRAFWKRPLRYGHKQENIFSVKSCIVEKVENTASKALAKFNIKDII